MLLNSKESAALYVMDLIFSNQVSSLDESGSAIENMETWLTSHINEEYIQISNKRNKEDIMMLLRY